MSKRLFEEDVIFLQRLLKCAGLYTDKIDGIWGSNTDKAVLAFETASDAIAVAHGSFDSRTEGCIRTLLPKTQENARRVLHDILAQGITARIISGTRTYAEQNELYKKGRFGDSGKKVTKAQGGQSNHNFGVAWDIGIFQGGVYLQDSPLYTKASEAIHNIVGVEWGGSWTSFPDQPHYQLTVVLSISDVRQRFESGQPYV